jgi:glycosyltransferase involved in cell wall biosynthesis
MKLIAIGFNTFGTGLTRVMHSILRRLASRHEIHYLGIGYSGEIVSEPGLTFHPTNLNGGDVFAAFQAARLIEEIQPDLVFILHDIWMFEYYLRILGPFRDRVKIAAYIPLDGKIVRPSDAAPLRAADRIVVYTEFARAQFQQAFERLNVANGERAVPAIDVIPHGVNLDCFFPSRSCWSVASIREAALRRRRKCSPIYPSRKNRSWC